jgi:hypothetical protein
MVELTPFGEDVKEAGQEGSLLGAWIRFLQLSDERNRSDGSNSPPEPLPIYRFPNQPELGIARGFAEVDRSLMEVMNNDDIILNSKMVKEINDPKIKMLPTGEITKVVRKPKRRKSSGRDVIRRSGQFSLQNILPDLPTKKKRKVSNYQKEFGKQMKKLKKKHPRTKMSNLMGKAHQATRKSLKR